MPNVALIPEQANRVPVLMDYVDGFPQGQHKLEAVAGGAPLENGAWVTDHAVAQGTQIKLIGWVSGLTDTKGNDPEASWTEIQRLHKALETLTIITPLGMSQNMLLLVCEASEAGQGYQIRFEFVEILRVGIAETDLTDAMLADGPAEGLSSEVTRGRVVPRVFGTDISL